MVGQSPQRGGKRRVGERARAPAQRCRRCIIQLFCNVFVGGAAVRAGLHPDLYSSKFQPRALQYLDQVGNALAQQPRGGARGSDQGQLGQAGVNHPDLCGEGWWQAVLDPLEHRDFALATVQKTGKSRFGG